MCFMTSFFVFAVLVLVMLMVLTVAGILVSIHPYVKLGFTVLIFLISSSIAKRIMNTVKINVWLDSVNSRS